MIGFAGLLLTSATGAKSTFTPVARASSAVTAPPTSASASESAAP